MSKIGSWTHELVGGESDEDPDALRTEAQEWEEIKQRVIDVQEEINEIKEQVEDMQ